MPNLGYNLGSSRVISGHLGTEVCEAGCSALILNALDQLCWLFNLRGSDIACNPVFLGYAVLTASPSEEEGAPLVTRARLFLRALDEEDEASNAATVRTVRRHLDSEGCGSEGGAAFVELAAYSSFCADEAALRCGTDGLVMLERGTTTMAMAAALPEARRRLVDTSPVEALKARKNEAEVAGLISAGRKDAAALCSYFAWLEAQMIAGEPVTEAEGADEIGRRRMAMEGCVGDSFPTISSIGPNAAVIHYHATHGACSLIDRDSVYLCDTGGQYLDGTTDVTRTLHFGSPTADERRAYTRVLQGHLDLALATFPSGTSGLMLECLARAPGWRDGMNFLHGTGHGIGAYLNVHEGPAGIGGGATDIGQVSEARRRMYLYPIETGHYLSDEPGFYLEGKFGIRIEADLIVVEQPTHFAWGSRPYLGFRYCSPVPFCRALIEVELLEPRQREWIDAFHVRCRDEVNVELLRRAASGGKDGVEEDLARSQAWLWRETQPL